MKGKKVAMLKKKIVVISLMLVVIIAAGIFVVPNALKAKAADNVAANEVADGMLDVKMQVQTVDNQLNMRVISSVNGLGYSKVGFVVYFDKDGSNSFDESTEKIVYETKTVYERIDASVSGVTYEYSPKVVDTDAEYFITGTVRNIDKAKLANDFYIRAFCVSLDGQKTTYGAGRYFNIEDANSNDIINIPVADEEGTLKEGSVVNVTVAGKATTATVEANRDGYAHLNIAVPAEATVTSTKYANKTLLASANKIEVTGITSTAIYRNLESKYSNANAGDKTWYSVDTSADAFIIATDADLYGLTSVATSIGAAKTVYVVSDIALNSGTVDSWKNNSFSGLTNWTPIPKFVGTFDGQGHSISGLYHYTAASGTSYAGMFKQTTGTLRNFSLKNSYLKSEVTVQPGLGSIVGTASGTLENIYSNAEVVTTNGMWTGGFAGCGDSSLTMNGCWFDGSIAMTYTLGGYNLYCGGFVGQAKGVLNLTDCQVTGNLNATYKQPSSNTGTAQNYSVGSLVGYCSGSLKVEKCLSDVNVVAYWEDPVSSKVTSASSFARLGSLVGAMDGRSTAKTLSVTDVYDFNTVTKQVEGEASATAITAPSGDNLIVAAKVMRLPENLLLGLDGCRYLALDFENTWAAVDGKLPQLKAFVDSPMELKGVTSVASYGWYSEGAGTTASPYVLSDTKDLYGFSFLSNSGSYNTVNSAVVKLAADTEFVMNEGTVAEWESASFTGLNNWKPIATFTGTFDGQGSVIKGLYMNTNVMGVGLFTATKGTIQNFSLKDSYLVTTGVADVARIGSIAGVASGGTFKNIYSNAVVKSIDGLQVGGFIGFTNAAVTLDGCWFDGKVDANLRHNSASPYAGGFVGQSSGGVFTMDTCLFSGEVNATYTEDTAVVSSGVINAFVGGFAGRCSAGMTLSQCLTKGDIYVEWKKNTSLTYGTGLPKTLGAIASVSGNVDGTLTSTDVYDSTLISSKAGDNAVGTRTNIYGGSSVPAHKIVRFNGNDHLLKGLNACQYTTLDFASADGWAAVEGELPKPKYFAEEGTTLTAVDTLVDFEWYGAGNLTTYTLDSKEDLYGFAIASQNDTFSGKTVSLGADITLNAGTVDTWSTNGFAGLGNWVPIGSGLLGTTPVSFAGIFDGNEYTISGLYLTDSATNAGLFRATTAAAKLMDFSLENSYLVCSANPVASIGSIVGNAKGGTMSNIYSDATVATTNGFKAGGLVGYGDGAALTMSGCQFAGNVIVNYEELTANYYGIYAGGIIGQATKSLTLTDCSFTGAIAVTYMRQDAAWDGYNFRVGGFVGRSHEADSLTGCTNDGDISICWKMNPSVDYTAAGAKVPTTFSHVGSLYGQRDKTPTTLDVVDQTEVITEVLGAN